MVTCFLMRWWHRRLRRVDRLMISDVLIQRGASIGQAVKAFEFHAHRDSIWKCGCAEDEFALVEELLYIQEEMHRKRGLCE